MASPKHLTAPQRARRKKIKVLIRTARIVARQYRSYHKLGASQILDDLADVAEKLLEGENAYD